MADFKKRLIEICRRFADEPEPARHVYIGRAVEALANGHDRLKAATIHKTATNMHIFRSRWAELSPAERAALLRRWLGDDAPRTAPKELQEGLLKQLVAAFEGLGYDETGSRTVDRRMAEFRAKFGQK